MLKKAPTDPNIAITRGYTKALSVLSKTLLKENVKIKYLYYMFESFSKFIQLNINNKNNF
jgi:hypothetical protein